MRPYLHLQLYLHLYLPRQLLHLLQLHSRLHPARAILHRDRPLPRKARAPADSCLPWCSLPWPQWARPR